MFSYKVFILLILHESLTVHGDTLATAVADAKADRDDKEDQDKNQSQDEANHPCLGKLRHAREN